MFGDCSDTVEAVLGGGVGDKGAKVFAVVACGVFNGVAGGVLLLLDNAGLKIDVDSFAGG